MNIISQPPLRRLCVGFATIALAGWPTIPGAHAQSPSDPPYTGFYLAVDAGRQNTIAGSLVAGIDMLKQATRNVVSVGAGYRMAFVGGVVAGAEINYGFTNGDLRLDDTVNRLTIDYANSGQISYEAILGYAFGPEGATMAFVTLGETKRSFDVTIRGPLVVGSQRDQQGLLRYGLGIEHRLRGPIGIRAMVGTSHASFGNRRTNIDPKDKIDVGIGLTWQF